MVNKICSIYREKNEKKKKRWGGFQRSHDRWEGRKGVGGCGVSNSHMTIGEGGREGGGGVGLVGEGGREGEGGKEEGVTPQIIS